MEITLAEMMFLCLGANCAPSLLLLSCQMLSSAGGPQRGVQEPQGERKDSSLGGELLVLALFSGRQGYEQEQRKV